MAFVRRASRVRPAAGGEGFLFPAVVQVSENPHLHMSRRLGFLSNGGVLRLCLVLFSLRYVLRGPCVSRPARYARPLSTPTQPLRLRVVRDRHAHRDLRELRHRERLRPPQELIERLHPRGVVQHARHEQQTRGEVQPHQRCDHLVPPRDAVVLLVRGEPALRGEAKVHERRRRQRYVRLKETILHDADFPVLLAVAVVALADVPADR
eukprot:31497-Pelagococcus_subviridis.AAC.8